MKANTDRRLRLAFGRGTDTYAAGRPALPQALVDALIALCGLTPSSDVLEIGPGTGQLTTGLIAAGLGRLTLVEADRRFEPWLQRLQTVSPRATVMETEFEAAGLPESAFDAIVASDSFHWLDPLVSYATCRRLLRPSGRLGLLWTFPSLTGRHADAVDRVVTRFLPELRLTSDAWRGMVGERMSEGEAEASAMGAFRLLASCAFHELRHLSAEEFASFVLSYAAASELGHRDRAALTAAMRAELEAHGERPVELERRIECRIYEK